METPKGEIFIEITVVAKEVNALAKLGVI